MKAHITQMLQQFHGQTRYRQTEALLRKLQSQNLHLERLLKEKDREVDQLKNQILNYEARLQELMGTDELTGLPNRHVFKEHLTHSLKRAVRLGYSLSLMLIDIDHLREINLKHGHEIGDKILIEVANVLRTSVREIDMPARWGGEELVAVLHETDADGAAVVAERVRKKIAGIEVKDPRSSKPVRVTATLALASYPRHSNDPQALLECVCEALITAKDKGVNSVIIAAR
jgi:two-component system, cell cycle response regulator